MIMKTILYFGLFDPNFSRNKVYAKGLKENGYTVLFCTDQSPGLRKYFKLFKKHWALRKKYDLMIIGYPGYIVVPFARLITRKKIIFDALCSFYETEIISQRNKNHKSKITRIKTRSIDWLAIMAADKVLVETDKQKEFFIKQFRVKEEKLVTVYTGVDETIFFTENSIKKKDKFTVLFRGRITNEAGAEQVLETAKILEKHEIEFLVIGYGWNENIKRFKETYEKLRPANVLHIEKQVTDAELRHMTQKCHVSLGQFAKHERLTRTIPHKAFEAMVMKLPYITARTAGVSEILQEGKHCLMVKPADPEDLAEKILLLKNDVHTRKKIAEEAYNLFEKRFTASKIVQPLIDVIQ